MQNCAHLANDARLLPWIYTHQLLHIFVETYKSVVIYQIGHWITDPEHSLKMMSYQALWNHNSNFKGRVSNIKSRSVDISRGILLGPVIVSLIHGSRRIRQNIYPENVLLKHFMTFPCESRKHPFWGLPNGFRTSISDPISIWLRVVVIAHLCPNLSYDLIIPR